MIDSAIEGDGPRFVLPVFEYEIGEIERTKQHFGIQDRDFVGKFLRRAQTQPLVKLTDDIWNLLENTDSHSNNILRGDWETVARCAESQDVKRDWKGIRTRMQTGLPVHAPLIARRGNVYHKVGGNTRLMVARALGIKPDVLIVDITDLQ